jgi:hypothetical protein
MRDIYCRDSWPYDSGKVTNFPSYSTRYLTILPSPAHTFHQLPRLFRHLFRLTCEVFTAELNGHMTSDKVTNFPSYSTRYLTILPIPAHIIPPTAEIVSAPFPAHMRGIYCRSKWPYDSGKVTNFPSFSTHYLTILPIPAHTFHQLPRLFRHLFRLTCKVFTVKIYGHMTMAR